MGIKERREREKLELREAILAAACQIAASEGWSGVSIRKIADRIEYSPPMVYEYFEDKDDLLYTLMIEGFRQLYLRLRAARLAAGQPDQAVLDMALAYWQFSADSPELYQVMHGLDGVKFCEVMDSEKAPEFSAPGVEVIEALTAWGQANRFSLEAPTTMLYVMWGALHGLVALQMGGRIQVSSGQMRELVQDTMRTLMRGWQYRLQPTE